jgi:hypothetical protein
MDDEVIARCFHETYEALAPSFGYETREASAKPWADVPDQNKGLMKSVVRTLIANGVISPGGNIRRPLDTADDRLEVRIRRGTTIDGAIVALCPDEHGVVTADVCIDGPPAP